MTVSFTFPHTFVVIITPTEYLMQESIGNDYSMKTALQLIDCIFVVSKKSTILRIFEVGQKESTGAGANHPSDNQ